MFAHVPWIFVVFLAYNAIAFLSGVPFTTPVFELAMLSGAAWQFTVGDLLLSLTLFFLFIEILKATRTGGHTLIDHSLSVIVFVLCLIEFLVVPAAATSLFFLITLTALIDVIAGFTVTMRAARREMGSGAERR